MNANRAIRIAAQRTQSLWGPNSEVLERDRFDRQRMLVIRIAAITLASDSAITIARFCPSKHVEIPPYLPRCFPSQFSNRKTNCTEKLHNALLRCVFDQAFLSQKSFRAFPWITWSYAPLRFSSDWYRGFPDFRLAKCRQRRALYEPMPATE